MSETVVAYARRRDALVSVLSVVTENEFGRQYALEERVVADGPLASPSARITAAWRHAQRHGVDDAACVADAVLVHLETIGVGEDDQRAPWHPRAWPRLRERMRVYASAVFRRLSGMGYEPARLALLLDARDPYAAYRHAAPGAPGLAVLPARFRTRILPLLRTRGWRDVMRAVAACRALGLEHDAVLEGFAVQVLLATPENGLAWLEKAGEQWPEQRGEFLRTILETAAWTTPVECLAGALDHVAGSGEHYRDRLTYVLASAQANVPETEILDCLRLVDEFAPAHAFVPTWRREPYTVDAWPRPFGVGVARSLRPLLASVVDAGTSHSGLPARLWDACARTPGLADVLARVAADVPSPDSRVGLVQYLVYRAGEWGLAELEARGRFAAGVLAALPEPARESCLGLATDLFEHSWIWKDDAAIGTLRSLVPRIARVADGAPPCGASVAALVRAGGSARAGQIACIPDRTLRRLVRASRPAANHVVSRGLGALAQGVPRLACEALVAHPEALFQAARALGCLQLPHARAFVRRFKRHPVMWRGFLKRPLPEIVARLRAASDGIPCSPVPRRLREHLAGQITLGPGSLERHRQAIGRKLVPFRLALLRRLVLEDRRGSLCTLDVAHPRDRHALQMLGSVERGRRALRRLLALPDTERAGHVLGHPANAVWVRRHPRVDVASWMTGIVRSVDVPEHGRVRLAAEHDPLEALRLGTEVGTCLSIGGINVDSAVAAALDVNKRVVFARRGDGRVVARQLVAISEDDRVVFRTVYPENSGAALQDAFYEYDLALCANLGLEPVGGGDWRVASIVTRDDYDDGIWDRFMSEDDRA